MRPSRVLAAALAALSLPAGAVDVQTLDQIQQRKDANQVEIDYLQSEAQLAELRRKLGRGDEIVLPLLTSITGAGEKREAAFQHRDGTLRVREGDMLMPGWMVLKIGDGKVSLRRRGHPGTYFVRLGSPWPTRSR